MAELRTVTTVFMKLDSYDPEVHRSVTAQLRLKSCVVPNLHRSVPDSDAQSTGTGSSGIFNYCVHDAGLI
jgi:hypothetical protein